MRLNGRSVLITGATGGIGSAIARELAARGCALTVTGRRTQDLQKLVSELGPPARALSADLTKPDEARDLVTRAGDIDVLVANAGVEIPEDLAGLSDAELEEAIRINLLAPAALAAAVLPRMKEHREGHIVFISSVAGLVATAGHGTGVGPSPISPGPVSDAGMFARSGVRLPLSMGTVSPQDVSRAVVRAVERGRPEITVATAGVRLSGALGGIVPVLTGRLARLAGAARVREAMLDAHARGEPTG